MKKSYLLYIFILFCLWSTAQNKIKPSEMSNTTKNSFRTVLGIDTLLTKHGDGSTLKNLTTTQLNDWATAIANFVTGTPWTSMGYYIGDGSAFDPAGSAAAITLSGLGGVPTSRTVNGHPLTSNVSVTASDVGLGNVTNESKATMFTSPTFTGTPKISTDTVSTKAYVRSISSTKLDSATAAATYVAKASVDSGAYYTAAEVQAKVDSASVVKKNGLIDWYRAMGDSVKMYPPGIGIVENAVTLVDGYLYLFPITCDKTGTMYNVSFVIQTAGNFVADNENSIGLFSFDGTTNTLLAKTANSSAIYTSAGNTVITANFQTPIEIQAGFNGRIGFLYNSSSQTIAPAIHASGATGYYPTYSLLKGGKYMCRVAASTMPTTVAESSTTNENKALPFCVVR